MRSSVQCRRTSGPAHLWMSGCMIIPPYKRLSPIYNTDCLGFVQTSFIGIGAGTYFYNQSKFSSLSCNRRSLLSYQSIHWNKDYDYFTAAQPSSPSTPPSWGVTKAFDDQTGTTLMFPPDKSLSFDVAIRSIGWHLYFCHLNSVMNSRLTYYKLGCERR